MQSLKLLKQLLPSAARWGGRGVGGWGGHRALPYANFDTTLQALRGAHQFCMPELLPVLPGTSACARVFNTRGREFKEQVHCRLSQVLRWGAQHLSGLWRNACELTDDCNAAEVALWGQRM